MNEAPFAVEDVHPILLAVGGLADGDEVAVLLGDSHGDDDEVVLEAGERDVLEGELLLVENVHLVEPAQHCLVVLEALGFRYVRYLVGVAILVVNAVYLQLRLFLRPAQLPQHLIELQQLKTLPDVEGLEGIGE